MDNLAIQLIVMVVLGVITAAIASSKGRSVAGWFFVGFFAGCIGTIIILCMSNLKQERAYREQVESEQRRLREQLRQERMKTESFRQYSLSRLDSHDQILGVDTRSAAALPGAPLQQALPADPWAGVPTTPLPPSTPEQALAGLVQPANPGAAPPLPSEEEPSWYYEVAGKPFGPATESDIRRLLRSKQISSKTLLWTEGMGQWTLARHVETFRFEAMS